MPDYLDLAKQAYEASTTYFDANIRADLEYGVRAFRSEHAAGSKYLTADFVHRSRLFRPKTRTIIRKNEAAAAVALFSNMDVVDMQAENPDDLTNVAATAALKEIIEYRLTRTIPAFSLVMGALQDAQVAGAVCSYQYWEYQKRGDKVVKDKPCIELRPLENIRFDHGASWIDPVGTSPYWCDIVPMYVCDVKAMMSSVDDKTDAPKWKKYDESVILKARPDVMDSIKRQREGGRQQQVDEPTGIKDFDIVWVMRWFMRDSQGSDQCFYTLGTDALLTDAEPIEKAYFHGKRPYVMGCAVIETHRTLPSSMPMLTRQLQAETNDVANQRMDNVKFVLNKRWIVRRGSQTDVQSLVRNVPGGVTMATNPKEDVHESNWQDVTSSSYVEQDRLNADFDDLAGNFSPSTKVANNAVNDTLGGSRMAAQGAGVMTDYLLRTFIETWWEPVLRQLVLLEQYYETDEVILSICANKAQLFPKFGISRITDMMLMNGTNVTVNVGMGASNPNERFHKFTVATKAATELVATAPPGFNVQEGIKEIYSNAGYRNGERFFNAQQDPRLIQAMQQVNQLTQALKGKQMEMQQVAQLDQAKMQADMQTKHAQLQVDQMRIQGDLAIRKAELDLEAQKLQVESALEMERIEVEKAKLQLEVKAGSDDLAMKSAELEAKMRDADMKFAAAQQKIESEQQKMMAEYEKAQLDIEQKRMEMAAKHEEMEGGRTERAEHTSRMNELAGVITSMKDTVSGIGQAVLQGMNQPKRSPKGITLQKLDGKTKGVLIDFDDGSKDGITIN
jgi:hypothetical protein